MANSSSSSAASTSNLHTTTSSRYGGRQLKCDDDHHASRCRQFAILALYKFVHPPFAPKQLKTIQQQLYDVLRRYQGRGNLLLATEGINGTVCFPEHWHSVAQQDDRIIAGDNRNSTLVLAALNELVPGLRVRVSFATWQVFYRLKIRIKSEIVTMGCVTSSALLCEPDQTGVYVSPGPDWHALLRDPDCWVIDTRNHYEVQIGTFVNAINPHTASFPEFPQWLQQQLQAQKIPRKIAMFCTGGIRCEKATLVCLELLRVTKTLSSTQFPAPTVYHLEGGILAYLDTVPSSESMFVGECFVFDQRVAVRHGLVPTGEYTSCHACRHPLNGRDRAHPQHVDGVCCAHCFLQGSRQERRQRYEERHRQIALAVQQQSDRGRHPCAHLYDPQERTIMSVPANSGD